MDDFFTGFEADICLQFKMWPEAQRSKVVEILTKETQMKQDKLEAEALAIHQRKVAE